MMLQLCLVLVSYSPITHNGRQMAKTDLVKHFRYIIRKDRRFVSIIGLYVCEVRRYQSILFNYKENNQKNALIVSSINLLISNYSNMFRPLS
jgi:hypothetical protein